MDILPRLLEAVVVRFTKVFPATVITGARQTGKSTLVRQPAVLGDRAYLTLDDLSVRAQSMHTPSKLLEQPEGVVLDEVQRVPDLLLSIKQAIDERRSRGRFVLTGSANLLLMERVSDSLAGRAAYLTLWPLTRREQLGFGSAGIWSGLMAAPAKQWRELVEQDDAPEEPWQELALRGGYPEPSYELTSERDRGAWFDAYTSTYLERDLRQLTAIENLLDLHRLMSALCLRLGNLVNQADLARDVGLAPTTVQRYLNLLETSYQLIRLPAYAVNRTKRLIKSPKIFWSDTGLALRLAGESAARGSHLENVIATDLLAWAGSYEERANILYWRTTKGVEVDFVIETGDSLLPIEVKTGEAVSMRDARGLLTFLDEYPESSAGLLLYTGKSAYWLSDNVLVAPWWRVV